jgi:hypothetical protein
VRPAYAFRLTSIVYGTGQFFFEAARIGHAAGVADRAHFCVSQQRRGQTETAYHASETYALRNCSGTDKAPHDLHFSRLHHVFFFFLENKNK